MTHYVLVFLAILLPVLALGCDEEVVCGGGSCVTETECLDICVEFCDGAVLDAFCSFDEFCTCECEFGCF